MNNTQKSSQTTNQMKNYFYAFLRKTLCFYEFNFNLLLPIDKPSHNRSNVFDIAFWSGPLFNISECNIAPLLDSTSDHFHSLTTTMTKRHIIPKQKLGPYTFDSEIFLRLLFSSIETIPSISTSPSLDDLDNYAENIKRAIQQAYSGAALRSLGYKKGKSWWD